MALQFIITRLLERHARIGHLRVAFAMLVKSSSQLRNGDCTNVDVVSFHCLCQWFSTFFLYYHLTNLNIVNSCHKHLKTDIGKSFTIPDVKKQ